VGKKEGKEERRETQEIALVIIWLCLRSQVRV
jgi:hypothetical protein